MQGCRGWRPRADRRASPRASHRAPSHRVPFTYDAVVARAAPAARFGQHALLNSLSRARSPAAAPFCDVTVPNGETGVAIPLDFRFL